MVALKAVGPVTPGAMQYAGQDRGESRWIGGGLVSDDATRVVPVEARARSNKVRAATMSRAGETYAATT